MQMGQSLRGVAGNHGESTRVGLVVELSSVITTSTVLAMWESRLTATLTAAGADDVDYRPSEGGDIGARYEEDSPTLRV